MIRATRGQVHRSVANPAALAPCAGRPRRAAPLQRAGGPAAEAEWHALDDAPIPLGFRKAASLASNPEYRTLVIQVSIASLLALHTGLGDVDFEFIPRQGIGVVLADSLVCAFL